MVRKRDSVLAGLRIAMVVALLLALMVSVGEAGPAGPPGPKPGGGKGSRGCGLEPPTVVGQTETLYIAFEGLERKYNVHLPPSYDPDNPHSLVLNFHGYNGNAEEEELITSEMSMHADEHGYIVVYPEAYPFDDGEGGLIFTWNDLTCNNPYNPDQPICWEHALYYPAHPCAPDECNYCGCQDDVGFVNAMLDEIEANYCIDTGRVYAAGFSTGGEFVQRLGCDLPERFAAIAPVHGFLHIGFNCAPELPISTMNIWGITDRIIPYDGSRSMDGYFYTPVDEVIDLWGSAQDCDVEDTAYPTVSDGIKHWTCTQRDNCATGAEVVSCSWRGPHWYPKMETSAYGNDAMWEFFLKNARSK
jgi:polyhydroxybutyrate depolymerase